jgi:alpha-methylacyl-CoA racemase
VEILAALLDRERTGHGAHLTVSMTHNAHRLAAHRLQGEPERTLTGGLACYRIYETGDGRFLTIAALEPKFWLRLCELIGRPELIERHYEEDQEALAAELRSVFSARPLDEWLALFDREDVMAGPVSTLPEAAARFGQDLSDLRAPRLGEHTDAWRAELASP